jgi:hypothetical protein
MLICTVIRGLQCSRWGGRLHTMLFDAEFDRRATGRSGPKKVTNGLLAPTGDSIPMHA